MPRASYKTPALAHIRKRAELTQEELAQASGVSASTVRGAEQGHSIGIKSLQALANALHVETDDLQAVKRRATRPRTPR